MHSVARLPSDAVEDVYTKHLLENVPVVVTGACKGWRCWEEWRTADGSLDAGAVAARFGASRVPIVLCAFDAEYGCERRQTCRLRAFLRRWMASGEGGESESESEEEDVLEEGGSSEPAWKPAISKETLQPLGFSEAMPTVYMKDWHMVRDHPDHNMYSVPHCFEGDWLNQWWDAHRPEDDYRFVYMGTAGQTFTPLHHDVVRSNSWSVNVVGCKLWVLFPPEETHKLLDAGGAVIPDGRWPPECVPGDCDGAIRHLLAWNLDDGARRRWPLAASAVRYVVVQDPGEAMFVPSGWYHQVHNLGPDDTLVVSINHNWFNETTLGCVWAFLKAELAAVRKALADSKVAPGFDPDWEAHVQLILRANSAMNVDEFVDCVFEQLGRSLAALRTDALREWDTRRCRFAVAQAAAVLQDAAADVYVATVLMKAPSWQADWLAEGASVATPEEWATFVFGSCKG